MHTFAQDVWAICENMRFELTVQQACKPPKNRQLEPAVLIQKNPPDLRPTWTKHRQGIDDMANIAQVYSVTDWPLP